MHSDDLFGALRHGSNFSNGDGAGVGREDSVGWQDTVEVAKDRRLDLKAFRGSFDSKRGRSEIVEFGGEGDARAGLVGLVLRELLFRHLAGEVGAYGVE